MSLLDLEDFDAPLNPSPSQELSDDMSHVSTNPAAAFLEDPSTVVLANSYSSGNSGTGFATMPRAAPTAGGGTSGLDIAGDSTGATPVKHSKLTKFIAHRRKASKGSIMKKGGNSPPLSPKVVAKPVSNSPEQTKKKNRYSALRDETDSASDSSLGRESPDNLDPSTGASVLPLFAEVATPVRGSTSSAGDIGSELSSPVGSSAAVGSSSSTSMPPGGLVRPPRQGQPSVAISQAVASGYAQGPSQVLPMASPWVPPPPQASNKANTILVPAPAPTSQQPVSQLAANSPWTSQTPVAAAGKESSAAAASTGQPASDSDWVISDEMRQKLVAQFWDLSPENGLLKGEKARSFFVKSKLPNHELSHIWKLSDIDEDNSLSEEEFCIAMKLVVARRKGLIVPSMLPEVLRPHPQSASGQKGSEQTGQKSPPTTMDWAKFPSNGSPPPPLGVEGPTDDEPNVVLPPPPSHGKRAARGSKQEGSASVPPSRSFEDMLRTVVGSSESELTETSTPGMHHRVNLSGKLASGASDNKGDAEQVNIDDSGVGALRPASTPSDSTPRSLSMAATGQLVQLESHVATADDPASKEASPVALHSEEEEEEEDERSALYTAVNKAWKTPKKKSPKLSQVESPSPTAEDSSEGRASASSGAEMEQLDSAAASGRSSQTKFTPPVVKPKPRRPPPPRPVPFAEHMKKLSSSPANVGKSEILPPTGSLVELEQDAGMFEVVGNKDGVGPQGRTTLGRLTSSQKHGSKEKPPPISAKPAGRGHERVGGVKLPGLEKMGADVGVGEIKTTVAGMKARGHQRTASLDSKKEELATSQEYQSLIEGLPPANPPALPPKPRKRGNFLEEPSRQTASGGAGRKISRSASMDSISSLSSHPGTAASQEPLQRPEGKTSPQGSPKTKKKPLPLPSTKLPIHPSRKPAQQADQPKASSRPSATPAEGSSAPTSHPHTQPVAPGSKQFGRVLKELQSMKPSSTHSGPDPAHPTAPAPHGADVLSVAIAIAEKASVLPSSSQHKSVLRDKSVVQGAIKTLQEEVGALKSTNMELQNQLCLLVEERNRLRARARAVAAKR